MRNLMILLLCWLLMGATSQAQSANPMVSLKLLRTQAVPFQAGTNIEAKVIELLKTSNFNSEDHPDKFPDGVRGVQRSYRDTIAGQYLLVAFPEPRQFEMIRGQATAIEVVVGLNNPQHADALFTIDSDGRTVEHSKFSGKLARELKELIDGKGKGD